MSVYRERPLTHWEEDMTLAGYRRVSDYRGVYWVGPPVIVEPTWRQEDSEPRKRDIGLVCFCVLLSIATALGVVLGLTS